MKGSEAKMTGFMEGADKRYVIPVYQRKYDWKYENCRQLYDDLKKIVIDGRDSHFFGSIVSAVVPNGSKIEYHIIDGQQRLTTITLLLLAIRNLITQGKVSSDEGKLDEQISQRFLISPWASEDDKIKLRPVKSDREALVKLFGDEEDYDHNLTLTGYNPNLSNNTFVEKRDPAYIPHLIRISCLKIILFRKKNLKISIMSADLRMKKRFLCRLRTCVYVSMRIRPITFTNYLKN